MLELERTYLAKTLPEGLSSCDFKEIIDIYIPASSPHPKLRLRKNGNKHEMTKKEPVIEGDASSNFEHTILLTAEEFSALSAVDGKRVHKLRYYYDSDGQQAEIDIFQDSLSGLVVVDFEFDSSDKKDAFMMPDFCLAEVTQESFIAGGMLCGKSYSDIEVDLGRFNYKKL